MFYIVDLTKTEGFISMCPWNGQDGLTISLQHIWSTFALAILLNRTFILSALPASATMREKRDFLPFIDLFDINIFRKAYGPNCCISPDEIYDQNLLNASRKTGHYVGLLNEFQENRVELNKHKHIEVCAVSFDFVVKANITSVYENTQPHPSIRKVIRYALRELYNLSIRKNADSEETNVPFVCMHLRTEPDFTRYFLRAPAVYTQEQILAKMNLTRSKYPNTTFAQLWSHYDKQSKPVLYLAGGNKDEPRIFFNKTDWFSSVENKQSLFFRSKNDVQSLAELSLMHHVPSSLLKSLKYEVSTVLALIDLEICKKADIFIGNNHSSLSERIATERQRNNRWEKNLNRTLENGGRYNYMVNGLTEDSTSWTDFSKLEALHPFCVANSAIFLDYKCNYVRSRM